jgi:hypothetical protein
MKYVILRCSDSARLCKDGNFRNVAYFGTFPECVKFYRSEGWARRKHEELKRQGIHTVIKSLKEGDEMDATGNIRFAF